MSKIKFIKTSTFTAQSAKSGSFVRPHKVSGGVDYNAAVRDRYGDYGGVDDATVRELRKEIKASFVEMVGFDKIQSKQSDYDKLVTGLALLKIPFQ